MSSKPSIDVLSEVLRFVPPEKLPQIFKSQKKLPELGLLTTNIDFSKICGDLKIKDFRVLLKNENIPKQTLFRCAVENGFHEEVKKLLLNNQVDPTKPFVYDYNALSVAASEGDSQMVSILLKDGRIDPNQMVGYRSFAISLAALENKLEVVKVLISDNRTNPSIFENQALDMASSKGHLDIVKVLLQSEKVLKTGVGHALALAIRDFYYQVAREILKYSDRMIYSSNWNLALIFASANGNEELVTKLLELEFINPLAKLLGRGSSIKEAYRKKHLHIVKILAQHPKVRTPYEPDLEILKMILESLE